MATPETLCIKWDDFHDNVTASFGKLINNTAFTDVTLVCEDGHYRRKVHKVVLSASSPFFQELFKQTSPDNQLIYLEGVMSGDLRSLVHFLYYGEVNIKQDHIAHFWSLVESFRLSRISESKVFDKFALQGKLEPVKEIQINTANQRLFYGECHLCGALYFSESHKIKHMTKHLEDDFPEKSSNDETETKNKKTQGELNKEMQMGKDLVDTQIEKDFIENFLIGKQTGNDEKILNYHLNIEMNGSYKEEEHASDTFLEVFKSENVNADEVKINGQHQTIEREAYYCDECESKFPNRKYLRTHKVRVHCTKVRCHICSKDISNKQKLKEHIKNVHDDPRFNCSMCGKAFRIQRNFRRHEQLCGKMKRKHKVFPCPSCKKTYSREKLLQDHIHFTHINPAGRQEKITRLFSCIICKYTLESKHTLQIHLKNIHKKVCLRCPLCTDIFPSRITLLKHKKKTHNGELAYECHLCQAVYDKNDLLTKHISRHHKGKRFQCQDCGNKFKINQTLKNHVIRIHSDLKMKELH